MKTLHGKVAVITGGASGIGRSVAQGAAAEGMKLVLADIEEGALKLTADALTSSGAEVEAVVTDVSEGSDVEALRDRALERFGAGSPGAQQRRCRCGWTAVDGVRSRLEMDPRRQPVGGRPWHPNVRAASGRTG